MTHSPDAAPFRDEPLAQGLRDEAAGYLRRRLQAEPERLASLLAEAEADAWQEVRLALRQAMVVTLFQELGGSLQVERPAAAGHSAPAEPIAPEPVPPAPPSPHGDTAGRPLPLPDDPTACPSAIYVYGIIRGSELPSPPIAGLAEGHPVALQPFRDLAAVVSRVPLAEYGDEALRANLADMAWLESRVRAHQAVLDAVLASYTLVPMKFATIYYHEAGVTELLAGHYEQFAAQFERLSGRQEWGLKLYCDDAKLAAGVGDTCAEVRRLQGEIEGKSKGTAYLLVSKLREITARETERMALELADAAHTGLANLSAAARLNPTQGEEITGHQDRMLLNAAYLVDAQALPAFQAAVADFAASYSDRGARVELTGPWPAYNFVDLAESAQAPSQAEAPGGTDD
ncbi:MAG: GvpL/GvpF family gas vesicle protein [Anaerolineae bacterium]